MDMQFIIRRAYGKPDTAIVRYNCECGCKPAAEYRQNTPDSGSEHCCCGHVHFVGPNSRKDLEAYLADRATRNMDDEVQGHTLYDTSVTAPWGDQIPVTYGLANHPVKH